MAETDETLFHAQKNRRKRIKQLGMRFRRKLVLAIKREAKAESRSVTAYIEKLVLADLAKKKRSNGVLDHKFFVAKKKRS